MSSLSTLQLRLSNELADSETISKTVQQRIQSINDACLQVYNYRKWPELYVNTTTQAVEGIINPYRNQDVTSSLWFGKQTRYGINSYDFVNQTDFFAQIPYTATVTEIEGIEMIEISDSQNTGFAEEQLTGDTDNGINDIVANTQVGQVFQVSPANDIEGVIIKLKKIGAPTGTLTINLETVTVGNVPSGTVLATATLNVNEINNQYEYFWVKFNTTYSATDLETLAITVIASYATNAIDYVSWQYAAASVIGSAYRVLYNGAVWSITTGDMVFVACSDYFNLQYVKKFIDMSDSTDDNGLSSQFDQPIAKLAAGILQEQKGFSDKALIKYFGVGGSQRSPGQNSAFGLLDLLWVNKRLNATRTNKRIKTVFDQNAILQGYYSNNNWWY